MPGAAGARGAGAGVACAARFRVLAARGRIGTAAQVVRSWLKTITRPRSDSPAPMMSFTASAAINEPICPTIAPTTPACEHEGTEPGAGGVGNTSRNVTPSPAGGAAQNRLTCASNPSTDAHRTGTFTAVAASQVR